MRKLIAALMAFIIFTSCFGGALKVSAASGKNETEAMTLAVDKEKTDYFKATSGIRWFKVKLKEDGILKLTFKSTALKQNGMIFLYYGETSDATVKNQSVRIGYDESVKTQKATLTSDTMLPKGTYLVCVRTSADTLSKETKYTLKAALQGKQYDDVEPNSSTGKEQNIPFTDYTKTEKRLNMNVTSNTVSPDTIDRFQFKTITKLGIRISVKSKGTGTLRVLLYQDKNGELKLINTEESQQYFSPEGKSEEFIYASPKKLAKGKYVVAVMLQDADPCYMDYSISASYYEPVTSISVAQKTTVAKENKKKLSVNLTPLSADEELTYKSSDKSIVTVDKNGVIKGIKKGTATITVKSKYSKKSAKCKVTVTDQKVKSITLNATSKSLTTEQTWKIVPSILPENALNKKVSYSSSNEKVAKVAGDGTVTAIGAGTATITVTAKDGSKKQATCTITVKKKEVPSPTITPPSPTITPSSPTKTPSIEQANPTITGKNNVKVGQSIELTADISGGIWSVNKDGVTLTANGTSCTVTGVSAGVVTVTYSVGGKSASISIFVKR